MSDLLSFASVHSAEVERWAPAAATFLLASIWRGALLACVVALALKAFPRLSAGTRSLIWLTVLPVVVVSPFLNFHGPQSSSSGADVGLLHVGVVWSYALAAVWVVFSAFRFAQLGISAWQLGRLSRRAEEVVPDESLSRVLQQLPRAVRLASSLEVDRPSVVGFLRPSVLLPPDLLASLTAGELEQIVLHEIEHLRRRDDWTNLLQKLSLALLPLHPVVMWIDRKLCLERELACDDGVLRATTARKSYAACLANLAEHSLLRRGVSLALGAVGSWKPRSEVAKRVCRILAKPEAGMGRAQARVAVGSVLAGVLSCAVALAHTPRLISFAPTAEQNTVAQTQVPDAAPDRAAHLPAASARTGAPHAVLATFSDMHGVRSVRATVKTGSHKSIAKRSMRVAPQQQRVVVAPMFRLTAWHEEDMPAPRFALAIQQDSQFTYAAVPVRDGWLIVQL